MFGEPFPPHAGPAGTCSVTQRGSSPLRRGRWYSGGSVLHPMLMSAQQGPLCSALGLQQSPDTSWRRLRLNSGAQAVLLPLGRGQEEAGGSQGLC